MTNMETPAMRKITLVAAMAEDRLIGAKGKIPWAGALPRDMEHFRAITMGHALIMGRTTWDSIPERFRPLPGRINIVMSRDTDFAAKGALIARDIDEALALTEGKDVMVIGGAQIYALFLPIATHLELTIVGGKFAGDAYFPPFEGADWQTTEEVAHPAKGRDAFPMTFLSLVRKEAPGSAPASETTML